MSEANGTVRVGRRVVGVVAKPRAKAARKPRAPRVDPLKAWAYGGAAGTLGLSGWLNGLAFSASAPTPAHGWVLGVAIPLGILVFSRVAATLYARGRRGLAYCGAGACLAILALSVQHCASSIAALTGEHVLLAGLMAVAIDVGLVVCELATVGGRK